MIERREEIDHEKIFQTYPEDRDRTMCVCEGEISIIEMETSFFVDINKGRFIFHYVFFSR